MSPKRSSEQNAAHTSNCKLQEKAQVGAPAFSTLISAQIETAHALRDVMGRVTRATAEIAERQAVLVRTSQDLIRDGMKQEGDPQDRIDRHAECVRGLVQSSAKHVAEVAQIAATCCCDAMDRFTEVGTKVVSRTTRTLPE